MAARDGIFGRSRATQDEDSDDDDIVCHKLPEISRYKNITKFDYYNYIG